MADNSNYNTGHPKLDFVLAGVTLVCTWISGAQVIQFAHEYEPVIRLFGTILSVFFAYRGWRATQRKN